MLPPTQVLKPRRENLAEHGGGGGFSLGAGDADDRRGAALDEQADLGGDGNARRRAASRKGLCGGIAGEATTRSAWAKSSVRCSPRRNRSAGLELPERIGEFFGGVAIGDQDFAPCSTSHCVTAMPPPKRPRPATVTLSVLRARGIQCDPFNEQGSPWPLLGLTRYHIASYPAWRASTHCSQSLAELRQNIWLSRWA